MKLLMTPEQENFCLTLITYAGNGRAHAFAALEAAKSGQFALAEEEMAKSEQELGKAHRVQTQLLAGEAQGVGMSPSLLLVHAQDQLMTAISERTLLRELINLYRRLEHPDAG